MQNSSSDTSPDQPKDDPITNDEALLIDEGEVNIEPRDRKKISISHNITFSSRLAEIDPNAPNLLFETAKPLLRILTTVPSTMTKEKIDEFRSILEDEIEIFFRICEHLSVKREHAITARYCLCTALDEAVNQTTWGGGDENSIGLWPKESLLSTFHKDSYGGDKLFLLTGKLSAHPSEHIDVLELIYYLLELGFEGRYRYDQNGKRQLEMIKSRLFNIISSEKQKSIFLLSPNWQALDQVKAKNSWRLPIWLVSGLALLFLVIQFFWYHFNLNTQSHTLTTQITNIGDIPFKPQKIAFEKPKLKLLLQAEIEKQILTLTESENMDLISFKGDGMFASGKTAVNSDLEPTFGAIVNEIKKLPNISIIVTGHSDNVPIRSAEFKNNEALSKARADAVSQLLQKYGYPANLITATGKGDLAPVANNRTAEGRAQNRRVEIRVQYNTGTTSNSIQTSKPQEPVPNVLLPSQTDQVLIEASPV